MTEEEHMKEVEGFVDYLIEDLDKKQLAVLYYQALHSTASMINNLEDSDERIDYNDLHDSNIDFMTNVIQENHTSETRQ